MRTRRSLVVVSGAGPLAASALLACTLFACTTTKEGGENPPPVSAAARPAAAAEEPGVDDAAFAEVADRIYLDYLAANPEVAVELGYHEYDGKIPDYSPENVARLVERAKAGVAELERFDPGRLSRTRRVEREVLLSALRQGLFQIEELRAPQRNPLMYSLQVSSYISRPYAPAADRARAVIAVAQQAPSFFAQAQKNLEVALPRTWVQIGILMTRGTVSFVKDDVPKAFPDLDAALKQELQDALAAFAAALEQHAQFLQGRLATATHDYALGEERFMAMLRVVNGVDTDLASLKRVADEDLAKNLAAMERAAKQIDPSASTADVVARVLADKPAPDQVLATATQQCDDLKAHLEKNPIVTIPSDDVAVVVETPPFLRFNFAFLDGAGPFEEKPLPSFYYITPPDPSWPTEKQLAYIPGKEDLLGTSIHEVWPGHFLHGLHRKRIQSKILKSFWNYAMGEGWAHYTEAMMVNEGGYRADDPKVQVGMLVNALLRNVRFVSAIGLHTGGMTVEESVALFKEKAFQDDGNAQQQAVRGTFDPMYLSYTVGKLMIQKLREDAQVKLGDAFSLRRFHDELLSFGSAPLDVIRREMLGPDAGPAL